MTHRNALSITLVALLVLTLGACTAANRPSDRQLGAVIGGVAGGAAGSQIGSGSGTTIATVIGTLAGAALVECVILFRPYTAIINEKSSLRGSQSEAS